MMTPSPINDISYYEVDTSKDYYTNEIEPQGKWIGLGALALKLGPMVETDAYRKIFNGLSQDGKPLCQGIGKDHRHGWDLTFSAPKSVSIIWAGETKEVQQKIEEAQQRAVEEAFIFVQEKVVATRRGHGGSIHENVAGLIGATFEHCSSRDLDPQLHTHLLVANVAPRLDGSWGTLESKYFYSWQKAIGAMYRSSLSRGLQELGYEVEEIANEDHFEIKGIDKKVSEYFSKRKKAILESMKSLGFDKAASKAGDYITLNTRAKKKEIERSVLLANWRAELESFGHSSEYISTLRNKHIDIVSEALPLQHILSELTSKQAVFKLQDIYAAAAKEAQFKYIPFYCIQDTVSELLSDKELVFLEVEKGKHKLYTTQSMLQAERKLIHSAEQLNSDLAYKLEKSNIDKAINFQEKQLGFQLSQEQVEAIYSVCQSSLDIVQGKAGAGKSISMASMRLAYEENGMKVCGATVSRQAALQLEQDTGIKSSTLAALLKDIKRSPNKYKNTVILLDEAGQLGSPDLLQLVNSVISVNAKLVLLGEQEQTDAINHGGSLRYLSQKLGCTRLNKIRRQRESWARDAVNELRSGNSLAALKKFNAKGLLNIEENKDAAQQSLVKNWQSYVKSNPTKESMILTHSWKEAVSISKLVREHYKEQGMLGDENIEVECAVSNKYISFSFSAGERVRFTKNDYRRNFTNGALGTITDVEKVHGDIKFCVRLDNGELVNFKQTEYSDENGRLNLVQAYASTVYSSQGATVDGDTFVLYTTGMDRASSYVAGSRHKDKCHWFASGKELDSSSVSEHTAHQNEQRIRSMARHMSVDRKNSLAIEYLPDEGSEKVNEKSEEAELVD